MNLIEMRQRSFRVFVLQYAVCLLGNDAKTCREKFALSHDT